MPVDVTVSMVAHGFGQRFSLDRKLRGQVDEIEETILNVES
jgi:hypothetical protein